ncbi:MAG: DNA-binding protein WhiA [Bacillota bacterium]
MSFDIRVKDEILKLRYARKEELLAFLSGVTHTCCELVLSGAGLGFEITSDFDTIHRVKSGFEYFFGGFEEINDPLTYESEEDGKFVLKYQGGNVIAMLEALQVLSGEYINYGLPNFGEGKLSAGMKSAYVAGAFVGSGKLTVPEKSRGGYAVEFSFTHEETAVEFEKLLLEYGILLTKIVRKERTLLLARTSEAVADVINLVGAMESFWAFHDLMVKRSQSEKDNRTINCVVANEDRSVIASVNQVLAIEKIKQSGTFFELAINLQEIANLRLENPNASIEELGKMANPPVSKSGANHRIRKIMSIAKTVGDL